MKNRIIAIANHKGGVGKTTTAINLSSSLALKNKKVLVIDLDFQGMTTSGLGKTKEKKKGIYQVIMNGQRMEQCVYATQQKNLFVCPASPELEGAEAELYPLMGREKRLREALSRRNIYFDFIFIDCPPSLGLLTINALTAADSILIPVQCEFFCMESIPNLFRTLDEVRTYLNPSLRIEGILLTMHDERTNLSKQVVEEIRGSLKGIIYETVIPRTVKLAEAPSFGTPVVIYDIRSKGAQAYLNLAEEILSR
jgi:chromosome partitioning protein